MITVATAAVRVVRWLARPHRRRPARSGAMTRFDRIMALVPAGVVGASGALGAGAPRTLVCAFAGCPCDRASPPRCGRRRSSPWPSAPGRGARLDPAAAGERPLGAARGRLRRDRRRADGADEPAHPDAAERPADGDDAGPTVDGGAPRPGGRMVNYDPQTYWSYPDSPQGVPDLNIIPGLPSVSGYASIVNGNYETTTHTHEQDDLDIGQLSSGTLDRLNLREVVTVPEYFLVPAAVDAALVRRLHADVRALRHGPGPAPRVRGGFQRDVLSLLPGPRPALETGQTASWFFGESLEPDTATLVLAHPARPGTLVRFGSLLAPTGRRVGGLPVAVAGGRQRGDGRPPARHAIGLSVQVLAGSLPSQRAVISVAGHPYELAGSLSSALVPGTVAAGRLLAGLRGLHPPQAGRARSPPRRRTAGGSPCRSSRARPSRSRSGSHAPAPVDA